MQQGRGTELRPITWFIRNQLEIELDLVLEQIEDISADADQNAEDIAKAG